jgi:hypothetical protein
MNTQPLPREIPIFIAQQGYRLLNGHSNKVSNEEWRVIVHKISEPEWKATPRVVVRSKKSATAVRWADADKN